MEEKMAQLSCRAQKALLRTSPLYQFFLKVEEEKRNSKKGLEEIIELHVGDPDNHTPDKIKKAAIAALKANKTHYVSATGNPILRKALETQFKGFEPVKHEIVISSGSRLMLTAVLSSLVDPGDKIIITAPYYPSFVDIAEYFGGEPIILDTKPDKWQLKSKKVEEIVKTKKVKALIINSPNNPTGACYSHGQLHAIAKLSREHGFAVISDECYEHFSIPMESYWDVDKTGIIVGSFSKKYAMTGWRMGFAVLPMEIARAVKKFLSEECGSLCPFNEEAAIEALKGNGIGNFIQQRATINSWLAHLKIKSPVATGGLYVFPNFSSFFTSGIANADQMADYLLKDAGVAVASGNAFGNYSEYLRIFFGVDEERLETALERMEKSLMKLK